LLFVNSTKAPGEGLLLSFSIPISLLSYIYIARCLTFDCGAK
jgi:hypothetical protein